ncbi:MAG TPA: hypothetical protein VFX59_11415 [Polyangiales bacterium]|nr:hypothetical protein [Polyangiales bacterium]
MQDPRTPPEDLPLKADGLQPLHEEPDPRELTDDERAASWLQAGGFEVG